jgi:hypothetical protein
MTFITNNLLFTYVAKNGLHIMQLNNNKGNNYYEWESNKGSAFIIIGELTIQ